MHKLDIFSRDVSNANINNRFIGMILKKFTITTIYY